MKTNNSLLSFGQATGGSTTSPTQTKTNKLAFLLMLVCLFFGYKNAYAQAVPELLYYDFNGTGTSVPNLASAPPAGTTTATIQGTITQGSTGQCGTNALVGNNASSTTDFLNTGWTPNLGAGSWTIAFWSAGFGSTVSLYYIFGDVNASGFRCFTNGVAGTNNWILRGAGLTDISIIGGALSTPTYNAFVYDAVANNVKAYLNGVLVSTVTQTAPNLTGTGPFKVMGYSSNIGAPVGGLLDDFRLYNRALDATEIALIATPPTTPTVNIALTTGINPSCFGNSATFTATTTNGGVAPTYQWTKNGTNIPLATLVTYTGVAGTDFVSGDLIRCVFTSNNTCILPANATVTSAAINMTVSAITISPATATLVGGTVGGAYNETLTQTGLTGTPTWSISAGALPAGLTIASATGIISGIPTAGGLANFTVSVASGGCSQTKNYVIVICGGITNTFSQTNVSCFFGNNGTASITSPSGGGGAPYTYIWNNAQTSATATGLSAGSYNCTITDANGCTKMQTFTITQPAALTNTFSQTNVSCFGGSNGTATVVASGGTAPYTYSWSSSASTTATASGLAAGTYVCTITDANTCTKIQSFTIAQPATDVVISPASLPNVTVGTTYNQTLTQTGLTGTLTWSISVGTIPTGLGLNASSGILSGTPANVGTFNFTVSVTNGTCSGTRIYSVVVACPTVTVTPTPTTQSYVVGTAISSITLGASGVSGATYTYAVTNGALPAGVTLSAGVISGTPTTATATTSFTITATASIGACIGTVIYNYSVACPTLLFGVTTATDAIVGTAYSLNADVTGNTATVVYSVLPALPAGLLFNTTNGAISGTPTAPVASVTYTVTATQGTCIATQAYTFAVVCPTLIFGVTTATSATVGTFYSLNAGVTGNTQAVVYSVLPALPAGLNFNTGSGAISGTPTAPVASATYTVTATQGTCTATQGYTFAIACVGIIINPASLTGGTVGSAYSQTITQTGLTGTPVWSLTGAVPNGLTIDSATGIISGTPTTTGTFAFVVNVTDGACSQTRNYSVVIACPTLVFGVTTATGGIVASAYTLNAGVTGNTGTIVYSVLPALPAGLSISSTTGAIFGTPTAVTASATYVVTATQTVACFATQSYTFGIIPNCTPVVLGLASPADAIVGTPYTHTFTATGGSVGATYTFSTSVALPAGLSLDTATGVISGTPTLPTTLTFLITAKTPAPNNCATTIGYNLTVKLNAITSIDNSLANLVKVSPNPSNGDFNVDFSSINMTKSSVRVYDAQGKQVYSSENNANLMTISLDKFANGIYLLEVKTENSRITKRLFKTN